LTEKNPNSNSSSHSNPLPWVIGALVVLSLAIAGGIYWHRSNKVERIQYTGLHFINVKEIKKQIKIPKGIQADSLNYAAIRKKIKAVPYVKDVRFDMSPGGTLHINITERTPIAFLIDGSKQFYIDQFGTRLNVKPGQNVNVPVLYGLEIPNGKDTTRSFKQTMHFLRDLHQNKAADATISEVIWNNKKGIIALTNNNGVKIIFGKSNFMKRMRNYNAFYHYVIRKEGIKPFHSIDLRFEGQIVTRED
jgi:cell division septal protein FtsQ